MKCRWDSNWYKISVSRNFFRKRFNFMIRDRDSLVTTCKQMESIESDSYLSDSDDNNPSDSSDSGSDFEMNDLDSDHSFSSETDSEVEEQDTESTLNDLDSQASSVRDRNFWSDVIEDMEVPEFIEPTGPTHHLPSDATPLQYFLLMFPLTLIQVIVDNTNLYARQSGAQGWVDTTIGEMKAFLGLQILMGIVQLPRYTMYWSSDKYIGRCLFF